MAATGSEAGGSEGEAMKSGVWIYNWNKKCVEWVENGKAYDSPQHAPAHNSQRRPYYDPGRPVVAKRSVNEHQ